ncbi:hypothetical protein T439DRAFT_348085 [Meredithblackwellia eburnea MCA 4105]
MSWQTIVQYTLAIKFISFSLLFTTNLLSTSSPFDSSSKLLLKSPSNHLNPLLRWDAVYFAKQATRGYQHEQDLAFMPGISIIAKFFRVESSEAFVMSTTVAAAFAGSGAALALFHLTKSLVPSLRPPKNSANFPLLVAVLFLLSPSPATLHSAPYTEPFFAFTTFLGMLLYLRKQHLLASGVWGLGTMFRAQGVVLGVGFFGWKYVLEEPRRKFNRAYSFHTLLRGIPPFFVYSTISAAPFLAYQRWVFNQFCPSSPEALLGRARRPWCEGLLGFSYGWIQREYWDVGPFRYWTLQQLPNFVLASPVLILCLAASVSYYRQNPLSLLPFLSSPSDLPPPETPFHALHLAPYIHLHTFLTLLLLTSSHVQIVLRVCTSNPVLYWYAATLFSSEKEGNKKWGRRWVMYCVVWGMVSVVLWSSFLPPA